MEVEVKQLLFHGVPQPQLDEVHQLKLVTLLANRSQQDILQLFKEQPTPKVQQLIVHVSQQQSQHVIQRTVVMVVILGVLLQNVVL
jgi:hypothetical protein